MIRPLAAALAVALATAPLALIPAGPASAATWTMAQAEPPLAPNAPPPHTVRKPPPPKVHAPRRHRHYVKPRPRPRPPHRAPVGPPPPPQGNYYR